MQFSTPVLFITFNRIQSTRQVFARIKQVKPKHLFIAADGPRASNKDDLEKCEQVRQYVTQEIDWPCELKTRFRTANLGCGEGPADAISWFFNEVEAGIILEDDCLPDVTFFYFCEILLKRYGTDARIMHISGTNFQDGRFLTQDSYYFSQYPHIWGWASWRRAWKYFDFCIDDTPEQIASVLKRRLKYRKERQLWFDTFKHSFLVEKRTTWDFQWCYAFWKYNGLSILPANTLITNIGLGTDASHTTNFTSRYGRNKVSPLVDIMHPAEIVQNDEADRYTFDHYFSAQTSFKNRLRNIAYAVVPQVIYSKLKKLVKPIS